MKHTTVIYHSADFDGLFCREIAKKFLGTEGVDYIGWDFGDKPLTIPAEDTIYVMDLPVDRVFGFDFTKPETQPGNLSHMTDLIWIDHHKTSIHTHPQSILGYRIDGVAACRLAWQWFVGKDKMVQRQAIGLPPLPNKEEYVLRKVSEPYAVRLAGEYDVWDKRDNPYTDFFQCGLKSVGRIPFDYLLSKVDFSAREAVEDIVNAGRTVDTFVRNQNAVIMQRTAHHRKWKDINFLVANLAIGNSQSFDSAVTPETEALMMWRHDGEKVHVSLYGCPNRPDLDLSVIAKEMGGGGHKQACGFTIGLSDFVTTILYGNSSEAVAV